MVNIKQNSLWQKAMSTEDDMFVHSIFAVPIFVLAFTACRTTPSAPTKTGELPTKVGISPTTTSSTAMVEAIWVRDYLSGSSRYRWWIIDMWNFSYVDGRPGRYVLTLVPKGSGGECVSGGCVYQVEIDLLMRLFAVKTEQDLIGIEFDAPYGCRDGKEVLNSLMRTAKDQFGREHCR